MAHFGFESIDDHLKAGKVRDLFQGVTQSYDLMNDVMSGGLHRLWKRDFLNRLSIHPGETVLDVASGTGDIIQGIYERYHMMEPVLIASDLTESMLEKGRARALDRGIIASPIHTDQPPSYTTTGIHYVVANAEAMPFSDNTIDVYTCAFGFRNMTHIDQALREAWRILKPGGRLYILEFSKVHHPILAKLYDLYSFNVIPNIGQCLANDRAAYRYLVESIRQFPDQETFRSMIQEAGFHNTSFTNINAGIVAIHSAEKIEQ